MFSGLYSIPGCLLFSVQHTWMFSGLYSIPGCLLFSVQHTWMFTGLYSSPYASMLPVELCLGRQTVQDHHAEDNYQGNGGTNHA